MVGVEEAFRAIAGRELVFFAIALVLWCVVRAIVTHNIEVGR